MTNKLFIVKYIFIININKNKNTNFDTNFNKRENFDNINIEIIITQNINFLNIANNIRSTKLNISIDDIINKIKKIWITTSLFTNKINLLKNKIN